MNKEKIKVLLVDENKKDYRSTKGLLSHIPHKEISLAWAKNYETAFSRLSADRFDVCLLEYRLGGRTGIDFLKKVKKSNCPVPIIILTGTKTHTADVLTMRHGAADYLVKDYVNASLLERSIRYALERQKTETERLKLLREQTRRIEAEIAERRVTLLADASKILATSLDYRSSVKAIARLLVPHMGDWCAIDILGNNGFERLVVQHKDPQRRKDAEQLEKYPPPTISSPGGVGKVLRTGTVEVLAEPTEIDLKKTARNDPKLLKIVKSLGIESYMIVPINMRGKVLGALTLVYGNSKRKYSAFDQSLMVELAQRIGLAIDNAMLYERSLESIRIREEFLNAASHELKTPLTSLQLQIQLLSRFLLGTHNSKTKEPIRELLTANVRQVHRLTKLINNLLDVSRIEEKLIDLEREKIDLADIIAVVVERFKSEATTIGSTIRYKNGIRAVGYFDRFRVDQVATNLLSNALKYGKGNPVEVTVTKKGREGILIVKDYGIGINPSEKERIFDRFERTDLTSKLGGLGLGLYIVSRIVTAHGGSITVSSLPHKGSTFTVAFPLTPPAAS